MPILSGMPAIPMGGWSRNYRRIDLSLSLSPVSFLQFLQLLVVAAVQQQQLQVEEEGEAQLVGVADSCATKDVALGNHCVMQKLVFGYVS